METNKLIAGIVAAAIAIIVLAGVLMPILSDALQTHDTYTNGEYYITMDKIDATSEVRTIEWTKANNTKIVVDGVEMEPAWESVSIVATETDLVRCTKQSGTCVGPGKSNLPFELRRKAGDGSRVTAGPIDLI